MTDQQIGWLLTVIFGTPCALVAIYQLYGFLPRRHRRRLVRFTQLRIWGIAWRRLNVSDDDPKEPTVSNAQREALITHRRRRRESGVVRVEVQLPAIDAALVRDLATILRGEANAAQAMRSRLRSVISRPRTAAVFDIFGSDLPDSYFDGAFDHGCHTDPPGDVDL